MDRIKQHFEEHAEEYLGTSSQLDRIWQLRRPLFEKFLNPARELQFLDVGGGAGDLADRILDLFPRAHVTIVDISQSLLDRNQPHPRKTLICQDLSVFFASERDRSRFDVINFDVLLHHVLTPRSFRESRKMQGQVLRDASRLLAPAGLISIREILYTSLAGLPTLATHQLLWYLSTRQLPDPLRRLLQRMGMKSQGGGVCFFSRDELVTMLGESQLRIEAVEACNLIRLRSIYYLALAGQVTDTYVMARRV